MLEKEIQQRKPFAGLEEEAFLNLQRTSGVLMQALTQSLKPHGLTPTQYNVLRILRGAHPEALTCGEIGERLVTPGPDVTRLVDRLVKHELVSRTRDTRDRRVVRVVIASQGLDKLGALDSAVDGWLKGYLEHLGEAQLQQLIALLEQARLAIQP